MRTLYEYGLIIDESKIHLKSDRKSAILEAIKAIKFHREKLVAYIASQPEFRQALKPIKVPPQAPRVVRIMTESSEKADVGPMASVAGALADLGMEAMLKNGAKTALVEDGGEIAVFADQPISVLILSGNMNLSGKLSFQITRDDSPLGIATSSSKTGHALSFGEADSVTVVAVNASVADASATAICNSVTGREIEESIQLGLERAKSIEGVRGVIIVREGHVGLWGNLPKIVKVT